MVFVERRRGKKRIFLRRGRRPSMRKLPAKLVFTTFFAILILVLAVFTVKKYLEIKEIYNFKIKELGGLKNQTIDGKSLSLELLCFELRDGDVAQMGNITINRINQWQLYIPGGVYVPDGEGGYLAINKLYAAGERLKKGKSGIEYVKERLDDVFGIEIDGYIATKKNTGDSSPCSYLFNQLNNRNVIFNTSLVKSVLEDSFSNINIGGLFAVAKSPPTPNLEISSIDPNRCETIEYQGESIRVLNEKCVDEAIRRFSRPPLLKFEQARVDVYNGTGIIGLASKTARRLKNSGIEVIRIEDAPQYEEKTKVYVTNGNSFSNTIDVIRDQLGLSDVEIEYTLTPFVSTGDIVVVLGMDSVKAFE